MKEFALTRAQFIAGLGASAALALSKGSRAAAHVGSHRRHVKYSDWELGPFTSRHRTRDQAGP